MRLSSFSAGSRLLVRPTSDYSQFTDAVQEFMLLIIGSVDNPGAILQNTLKALIQDIRIFLTDGVVTFEELANLSEQIDQLLLDAGVSFQEREMILAQFLDVAAQVVDMTDREPLLNEEFATQLQTALSDGFISNAEKEALRQAATDNINEKLQDINQEFFQELENLRNIITESIDNPLEAPTVEEIQEKLQEFRIVIADGISPSEGIELLNSALEAIAGAGIDATEARNIILQSQAVVVATNLMPAVPDNLTGTTGNDFLIGNNGNDTLTGASTDNGRGDIDTLLGGAGADTFVLGDESTVFYDDGFASTQGLSDYAIIVDFNPNNGDVIQLSGNESGYILGSIPQQLLNAFPNLDGTGIFTNNEELIGVIFGLRVSDFNIGFTFA